MISRTEKIAFLKGLAAGQRSIQELIKEKFIVVMDCVDDPESVYDVATGQRFTANQVDEWRHKAI